MADDITTDSLAKTIFPRRGTYKIVSISSRVFPFVSGRKKNDQMVASSIQEAQKNHVPYPRLLKMYGRALVITNWINLLYLDKDTSRKENCIPLHQRSPCPREIPQRAGEDFGGDNPGNTVETERPTGYQLLELQAEAQSKERGTYKTE
jgi:hypothetical protein